MAIKDFNELNKDQLKSVGDQFGSDIKLNMAKPTMLKILENDGVTVQMYNGLLTLEEEDDDLVNYLEEGENEPEETVVDEDDEGVILLKMTRPNFSYQVRGYHFTRAHPFMPVKESDADFLIENVKGFRPASPKEMKEFYG